MLPFKSGILINLALSVRPWLCYSAQNGSESRFRDRCFLFFVLCSVTDYGLFYCTIVFVSRHWRLFFSVLFEFQVIRKGCEGSGDDS